MWIRTCGYGQFRGELVKYYGGTSEINSRLFSISKNRILRAALCLVRYLV